MQLHQLPKTTSRSKKRLGQGYGSGKGGHTSSRGQKGQRSRSHVSAWFEGGQLPQIRRFPFIRGKNRFVSLNSKAVEVNVTQLNSLPPSTSVTAKVLIDHGIIKTKSLKSGPVKILGRGQLTIPLTVTLPVTQLAQAKIIKAGGKVVSGQPE